MDQLLVATTRRKRLTIGSLAVAVTVVVVPLGTGTKVTV
jgi:hypothetical protein